MITKSQLDTLIATAHNVYQNMERDDGSPTHSRHALEMCNNMNELQQDLMQLIFDQSDTALHSDTFDTIHAQITKGLVDLLVLIKICDEHFDMNDLMSKAIAAAYKRSTQL